MVATRLSPFGHGRGSGVEIDTELYHQVATFRDRVMCGSSTWPRGPRRSRR